jgi:hypothetical protein
VSFRATGTGEQWDPTTGEKTVVEDVKDIPLELDAYDGMFFRFASK